MVLTYLPTLADRLIIARIKPHDKMATAAAKPIILMVSVGDQWMRDILEESTDLPSFSPGIDKLLQVARLKRARTAAAALKYLDDNIDTPPRGILVTDPAVAWPENKALLQRIVSYVREGGGTAVLSYCFSTKISMDGLEKFWRAAWGLPWAPGSYHRTDHVLNRSAAAALIPTTSTAELQEQYSQKALHLKNVPREHSLYLPTADSRTQSRVYAPNSVDQSETPVAFAPLGRGRVGYTGDVNMEVGTQLVVVRMFLALEG